MKNTSGFELFRETTFKDSVLTQAETRSTEIIAEAGKKRADVINQVQLDLDDVDPALIEASLQQKKEQNLNAFYQTAQKELLERRGELVDAIFKDIEENLIAFTQSDAYLPYLIARLEKHADFIKKEAAPQVFLRPADTVHKAALKERFATLQISETPRLILGGLWLSGKAVLFDESLDEALRAERDAFIKSGTLSL